MQARVQRLEGAGSVEDRCRGPRGSSLPVEGSGSRGGGEGEVCVTPLNAHAPVFQ